MKSRNYKACILASTLLAGPLFVVAPLIPSAGRASLPLLLCTVVLLRFAFAAGFTSVFTLINNSVPPSERGRFASLLTRECLTPLSDRE